MSNRLVVIREKLAALKAEEQKILNREKQLERKKRTRELIEVGGIIEKYLGTRDKYEIEAMCLLMVNGNNFEDFKTRIKQRAVQLKQEKEAQKQQNPAN